MQHAGQADDIRSGVESERYRKAVCQTAGMCRDVLNVFLPLKYFMKYSSLVLACRTNGRTIGTVLRPSSVVVVRRL